MSQKVKVRRVVENVKSGAPILLNFEHAGVNKSVDISTRFVGDVYESDPLALLNTEPGSRLGKRKQVVIVQGETDMTYVGQSDGPLNTNTTGLRTFLAIRHKSKLKVYEAKCLTVSPYISNRAHLIVKDSKKPEEPHEKKKAAADLVKAFGSKKKRLSYERHEKNEIDSQNMNESINLASDKAVIPTTIAAASPGPEVSIAPPCNRDTKDVTCVYSVNDILSQEELDDMEELAKGWLGADDEQVKAWKASKRFSDYFFEMHRRLAPRKADQSSIYKAKLVLYTELLICLLKLGFNDLRKKVLPLPAEFDKWLVDKALSDFTILNARKIRCRSDALKDKTCGYIMVLVLLANEYLFDVQLMSTSLQIHINKLLTLAKVVGITTILNPASKQYRGLLKLPLPKLIERKKPKRKTNNQQ